MGFAALTLTVILLLRGCEGAPLLSEVESPALMELTATPGSIAGGAWVDVDGDGDLDFALSGDHAKGNFVQWLENRGSEGFVARSLDRDIEDLPDESVRDCPQEPSALTRRSRSTSCREVSLEVAAT